MKTRTTIVAIVLAAAAIAGAKSSTAQQNPEGCCGIELFLEVEETGLSLNVYLGQAPVETGIVDTTNACGPSYVWDWVADLTQGQDVCDATEWYPDTFYDIRLVDGQFEYPVGYYYCESSADAFFCPHGDTDSDLNLIYEGGSVRVEPSDQLTPGQPPAVPPEFHDIGQAFYENGSPTGVWMFPYHKVDWCTAKYSGNPTYIDDCIGDFGSIGYFVSNSASATIFNLADANIEDAFGDEWEFGSQTLNFNDGYGLVVNEDWTLSGTTISNGDHSIEAGGTLVVDDADISIDELSLNNGSVLVADNDQSPSSITVGELSVSGHAYIGDGIREGTIEISLWNGLDMTSGSSLTIKSGQTVVFDNCNLQIQSGREVIIEEGATLEFSAGKGIFNYGTLTIDGSETHPVILAASSSSWAGVKFEYGSTGAIDHAAITGAGIWIDDAQVEIDSTVVEGTTGSVLGVLVEGSSADVDISGSSISDFLWAVLYTDYANGTIHHDTLDGISKTFGATYYADPSLTGISSPPGANMLLPGASHTISTYSGATVVAGIYPYNGSNQLCDGGTHDIYAYDATVYFYGNYWPSSPVFTEVGSGDIQEGNRLGNPCTAAKAWGGAVVAGESGSGVSEKLVRALEKMARAESETGVAAASLYDEAATLLVEVEADDPASPDALSALVALFRLSRLQDTERYIDYFHGLASGAGPDQPTARDILVEAYRYFGYEFEARTLAEAIAKDAEGNWHAFLAQITLFEMDLASGHLAGAAARLEAAVPTTEADEFRLARAVEELVRAGGTVGKLNERAGKEPAATEDPPIQVQAYPNPFNPTTALQLRVPDDSQVEVVAFDILGRQVALLYRGVLAVGTHAISWDATGQPSGTYFVLVRMGDAVRTLPIVLQK